MFKSIVYPKLDLATLQTWWSEHSQATSPLAIKYVAQCDSTNAQLYRSPHQYNTLLVAEQQSHGKGQFERAWVSQSGDLIFSIGLLLNVAQLPALSLRIGLALHQVLTQYGIQNQLKWPNDVIATHPDTAQRGKLAGVLVQSLPVNEQSFWVVLGVGLNVSARWLPQHASNFAPIGLAQLATEWMSPSAGAREILLMQLVDNIMLHIETTHSEWVGEWNTQDLWRNLPVTLTDPQQLEHHGIGAGINAHGEYQLVNDASKTAFHSGQLKAQI